jgi:hypothetical protein
MAEVEVTEAEVQAMMGAAWDPKLRMIAAGNVTYSKQDGVWYRYDGAGRPPEHYHRELDDPQAEREFWEHGRAVHEAAQEGEL